MKTLILLPAMAMAASLHAQYFDCLIRFYNRPTSNTSATDTIRLGYAPGATDTLDAAFNETDITGQPYIPQLDVRIANAWNREHLPQYATQPAFETKRQIVPYYCGTLAFSAIEIHIVTKHWPVTVDWERQDFEDSCRRAIALTDMMPQDWWQGPGFKEVLSIWDYHPISPRTFYLSGGDTVRVFWFGFGDEKAWDSGIEEVETGGALVYPNPVKDKFYASLPNGFGRVEQLQIFSAEGKLVYHTTMQNADVSFLEKGVYLVTVEGTNGKHVNSRFIKED